MKTIWKYEISLPRMSGNINMPRGAQVLTIQMQGKIPCIWALVDSENGLEERWFEIYGTGHEILHPRDRLKYINTFQVRGGEFIFHLFERGKS